jgi:hypothetical protein
MVTSDVPLPPVAVAGLIVQVVVPSEPGTLQVRATSELKPPTAATVRLVVMSCPLATETTGLATVRVKSGMPTVTGICSVCVSEPLAAVMVMVPDVAVEEADMLNVLVTAALGFAVAGFGLNEHVRPAVPVQE